MGGEWFATLVCIAACEIDQACCEVWAAQGLSYAEVRREAIKSGINPEAFADIMVNAEVPESCH